MAELEALAETVSQLQKNIADFPIGASSIDDLKSTEEKIQDLKRYLKGWKSKILTLKAKEAAQKLSGVPEESDEKVYHSLQERIAECTINDKAIETCLHNTVTEEILAGSEDNELSNTLKVSMHKLYNLNDKMIQLEEERVKNLIKETELKIRLQESLLKFSEFLKEQEDIRQKKLEETNPGIARQKQSIQQKISKMNVMKRMITNMIGASDKVNENPFLKEMLIKHRELVDIETIEKMAQETSEEES